MWLSLRSLDIRRNENSRSVFLADDLLVWWHDVLVRVDCDTECSILHLHPILRLHHITHQLLHSSLSFFTGFFRCEALILFFCAKSKISFWHLFTNVAIKFVDFFFYLRYLAVNSVIGRYRLYRHLFFHMFLIGSISIFLHNSVCKSRLRTIKFQTILQSWDLFQMEILFLLSERDSWCGYTFRWRNGCVKFWLRILEVVWALNWHILYIIMTKSTFRVSVGSTCVFRWF